MIDDEKVELIKINSYLSRQLFIKINKSSMKI